MAVEARQIGEAALEDEVRPALGELRRQVGIATKADRELTRAAYFELTTPPEKLDPNLLEAPRDRRTKLRSYGVVPWKGRLRREAGEASIRPGNRHVKYTRASCGGVSGRLGNRAAPRRNHARAGLAVYRRLMGASTTPGGALERHGL